MAPLRSGAGATDPPGMSTRRARSPRAALLALAAALAVAGPAGADRTVSAAEIVIVSDEIAKTVTEIRHAAGAPARARGRTWAPAAPAAKPAPEPAAKTEDAPGWGGRR